jgi:hypothetical protein
MLPAHFKTCPFKSQPQGLEDPFFKDKLSPEGWLCGSWHPLVAEDGGQYFLGLFLHG